MSPSHIDDPRFKETFFLVEATHTEKHFLWSAHHEEITWVQEHVGLHREIGELADHPVCINVFWDIIGGKRILFYEGVSRVVDHQMIDDWIMAQVPHLSTDRRSDAGNFHNCILAIRREDK